MTAEIRSVITYSNGDRQVVVSGAHPEIGEVVTYSNGDTETVVNVPRWREAVR